jgi:hypothetical protein
MASRINCRCVLRFRSPLWSLLYSWRHHRLIRDLTRTVSHQAISPDSSGREQCLDQQRFRPLGKLVVGDLDRITDVDNIGN